MRNALICLAILFAGCRQDTTRVANRDRSTATLHVANNRDTRTTAVPVAVAPPTPAETYHPFRSLRWGMSQTECLASLGHQPSPEQNHELAWQRVPHPGDRIVRFHDEANLDLEAVRDDCFTITTQEDLIPSVETGNEYARTSEHVDTLGSHSFRSCCRAPSCRMHFSRWGAGAPRHPGGVVHVAVRRDLGRIMNCSDDTASFGSFAVGGAALNAWQRCTNQPGADGGNRVMAINGATIARRPRPVSQYENCARWEVEINGECVRREVIQLVFWRDRLYGIVFYPIGLQEADTDSARSGGLAALSAVQRRLGPGTESNGDCAFVNDNSQPCTRWTDTQTDFGFGHRRFIGGQGLDEVVVVYRSREMFNERQRVVSEQERAQQNAAQTAVDEQANSIGSRF
jgi:hypothetical protein